MKKALSHINKKGFSLIELLVSTAIFIMIFIVVSDVTVNSSKQLRHVANKERAILLAEAGLESARHLHDEDLTNLDDGPHGISTAGDALSLSGISDTADIFTRTITNSTVSSEQKRVVSTVTWADQISPTNSVSLITYLTNWRAIIDVGLTMTKKVITHGGYLLAEDMLPTELKTTRWDNSTDPPTLQNVTIPIDFFLAVMNIIPGTYTFDTTNNPDYQLTLSSDCGDGSIVINNGDAKLCIITYEEYYAPIVINATSSNVTATTATLGAEVSELGLPEVISERGVCYGTTPSPTSNCTDEGQDIIGTFTQPITGLTANTTYYFRGYAINTTGTGYSPDGTFTTLAAGNIPTITTTAISNIVTTTASSGGNVTSDGGQPVTARGVVWSTSANPTVALPTKTSDGTGTGSFVSALTGLAPNTQYYVRAYATNAVGTAYGSEVIFTTLNSSVTFIAAASAGATSIVIPVHQVGDLLIMFAYRDGNATAPSLPVGWTNIGTATGASLNSSRLAYKIATATNDASGTWTSATGLVTHVYRGQNTTTPIGSNAEIGANGTIVTYPALTMTQSNGTSKVAGFAGHRSTNTALQTPPTGMQNRTNLVNATNEISGHDTPSPVSAWSATNVTIGGTSSGWRARTVEILSQ